MPWNEPGSGNSSGGSGDRDPWGGGNRNRGNQSPDLEEVINNVRKRFGGGGGRDGSGGRGGIGGFSPILIFIVLAIIFWSTRSVYTVQEGYESIELRFGKYSQTVGAGLQFVFWPIEQNIIINSQNIRTVEIGFRKDTGSTRGSVPQEAQMLTTDENIADVSLAVQTISVMWKICCLTLVMWKVEVLSITSYAVRPRAHCVRWLAVPLWMICLTKAVQ